MKRLIKIYSAILCLAFICLTINYNTINIKANTVVGEIPVFSGVEDIKVSIEQDFDPLSGVIATDKEDKDISSKIEYIGYIGNELGDYYIKYVVMDSDNNYISHIRKITLVEESEIAVTPGSVMKRTVEEENNFEFKLNNNNYLYMLIIMLVIILFIIIKIKKRNKKRNNKKNEKRNKKRNNKKNKKINKKNNNKDTIENNNDSENIINDLILVQESQKDEVLDANEKENIVANNDIDDIDEIIENEKEEEDLFLGADQILDEIIDDLKKPENTNYEKYLETIMEEMHVKRNVIEEIDVVSELESNTDDLIDEVNELPKKKKIFYKKIKESGEEEIVIEYEE